jgi:hypothetical protein
MKFVPKQASRFLKLDQAAQDVHDFLGVVYYDPALRVLVLPEHVATLLRVAGTDYLYAPATRAGIVNGWIELLNGSGLSVQAFFHRRPINWEVAGGHLDIIKRQVDEANSAPDSWERRRFELYREALTGPDTLANVNDIYQYVVVRLAIGATEAVREPGEGTTMYLPPKTGWRFWERAATIFGGPEGQGAWEAKAQKAARELNTEVQTFMGRAHSIPDFSVERASALEVVQLLHLLFMEDEAYAPGSWVRDVKMMRAIVTGTNQATIGATATFADTALALPEEISDESDK